MPPKINILQINILGVSFDVTTKQDVVEQVQHYVTERKKAFVVTANPEIVWHTKRDPSFLQVLQGADHVIADGIGIVLASRLLGTPLPERVPGIDVAEALLSYCAKKKRSVFLYGAHPAVLPKAVRRLQEAYPGLYLCGSRHGYLQPEEEASLVEEIRAKKPDLVLVALGSPAQENWIHRHYNQFANGVFIGVGGSFDVWAGEVKRAPQWMQQVHLEWLYRLLASPKRWRRLLFLPAFLMTVMTTKKTQKT